MIVKVDRRVICSWCRADITPVGGLDELDVVHCQRCGCTRIAGRHVERYLVGDVEVVGHLGHDHDVREFVVTDPPAGDPTLEE